MALPLTIPVDDGPRHTEMLAEAHAALDRMGVKPSPHLELRVLELERSNRAAVPPCVWGGRT